MHNLKSNKMKNLLLAVTVMLFGYSASAQNTKTILDNYLSVKNALVNSDSKTASEAVEILYKNIKSENDFSKKEDLLKAADKLNKAGNSLCQRMPSWMCSVTIGSVSKATRGCPKSANK